jgi:hypothetical protein
LGLSREEAIRLKDRLAADFMSAARCFDPAGMNSVAVTNVLDGRFIKTGPNSLAVEVGTKQPLTESFKKEIEDCAADVLGRRPSAEDMRYIVNPPYRP